MPFTPTDIEPCPRSKVTVTFAGLMLLRAGADNTLEIGVHKYNRDHTFQVLLIVNKPQRPPRVIRLLTGTLMDQFNMVVEPAPDGGVWKFVASNAAFDRGDPNNHPLDFRWAINFKALPGHEEVDFNEGAEPIATLNAGVLYTPNLTRTNLEPVLKWGGEERPLHRFSSDLAASVELPQDTGMTLSWTELGKRQDVVLPRDPPDPDGTTYTVVLLNDPAYSDPTPHDELEEYYKILRIGGHVVSDDIKCRIEIAGEHKTDEIPCLAGVLDPPGAH
jgi:hypothetical protein